MRFERHKEGLVKLIWNKQAWHDSFYIYNFLVSFTLFLFIWGEAIWAMFVLRGVNFLTLHYSIYFGVDWVGGIYNFLVFSGIATGVFVLNFCLANIFYGKKRILSQFLVVSAPLILLLILIGTSIILYINWNGPGI
ncbi:MAG: hypothetical protein WC459_04580 [Patescibacteria group bacterium]